MNRRMLLAAGMSVLAGGTARSGDARAAADAELESALRNPQGYMFVEKATSKTDPSAPHSFEMVVTSARGVDGKPQKVSVRPGTMRVFRADAGVDEFTRQGGWYWKCGKVEGKSQFKQAGALILVVRQQDGAVEWYSLQLDFRC